MEKKKRIITHLWVGALAVLLLLSCNPDEPPEVFDRVVLAYLIGDNNLDIYLRNNLEDMGEGMAGVKGKLLVYHDGLNETPKLYLIDSDGEREKVQELSEETSSCSPERLKEVLDYLFKNYPARSYGMILSSHGYGWVPFSTTANRSARSIAPPLQEERLNPLTRHFGYDVKPEQPRKFEIQTLASCFPQDRRFDFLFFDACFMASIESLYEMRNCSHYTLASQAEVLAYGAPFDELCKFLFADNQQLPALCEAYLNFYQTSMPGEPSASIALIDNTQLEPLAQSARSLLEGVTTTEIAEIAPQVQVCEQERSNVFYDLGHFYSLLRPQKYAAFQSTLSQAILIEKHTNNVYSDLGYRGFFSAKNFTGINCFIPLSNQNTTYRPYYYQTEWAQAVGMPKL